MNCPNCRSTRVYGPVYHHRAGRRLAAMFCRSCQGAFDAYELFGAGEPRRAA
jgi:hypothetical protein